MPRNKKERETEYRALLRDVKDHLKRGYSLRRECRPCEHDDSHAKRNGHPHVEKAMSRAEAWKSLGEVIRGCQRCSLHCERREGIRGSGSFDAPLLLILDPPDEQSDKKGMPASVRDLATLKTWLAAISLSLEKECFLTNVVKCRPPGERRPFLNELATCYVHTLAQVKLIKPRCSLLLGRIAHSIREERNPLGGLPLFATFHPRDVLKVPSLKRDVWEELKRVKSFLER